MNKNRSLISKEPELAREIHRLRKEMFEKEKQLFLKLDDLVSIRTSIKDFYAKIYLPRLGRYMEALEEAKSRAIGLPPKADDSLKHWGHTLRQGVSPTSKGPIKEVEKEHALPALSSVEGSEAEGLTAEVKKEIKDIYRRLARLYHPDRPHNKDEQEFLTERMAAINEAFQKADLDSLKRYLRRADAEIGLNLSSLERIKCLGMELSIVESMDRLYAAKVADVKKNEIYKLMKKDPARREEVFKGLENRFKFDIGIYRKILKRLADRG